MASGDVQEIAERRDALERRHPDWTPRSLGRFLADSAVAYGERPLVITDERTGTYADIDAAANRLADGLIAIGVAPGERVGVIMANYYEFVPLKFAIARAGAVAIPFNYLYRSEELAYVLSQSGCNVLITMTSFSGLDYLEMLDAVATGWRHGTAGALPELRTVVTFDPDDPARRGDGDQLTLADLEQLGADGIGAASSVPEAPSAAGDILYTSGTTGSPKGVVVSHDAVLRTAYGSALTRAYEDGRRVLFSLPCYHMFGYVEGLLSVMFVGGAIVPRTAFSPADYFEGIERHRANDILAVPTMTVALLEHPDRLSRDLGSLNAVLSGAAPAPPWVWERAETELGITEITTGYGMTECGGAMTLTLPEDAIDKHTTTVGRIKMAGAAGFDDDGALCRYRTVDPVSGEPLDEGAVGELVSQGPTHMMAFWDKPAETEEALRGGWLHSGDLGFVGPDGYLRLTGRSKELYKSGGELVMPKEIEELVANHPGVSQVYAIGVPDERWGEAGCLCVVPDPGAALDLDEILELCRANLARFKVPKHIVVRRADQLPTTPTGKVQKYRLVDEVAKELADG